jgi:hypothetical protein
LRACEAERKGHARTRLPCQIRASERDEGQQEAGSRGAGEAHVRGAGRSARQHTSRPMEVRAAATIFNFWSSCWPYGTCQSGHTTSMIERGATEAPATHCFRSCTRGICECGQRGSSSGRWRGGARAIQEGSLTRLVLPSLASFKTSPHRGRKNWSWQTQGRPSPATGVSNGLSPTLPERACKLPAPFVARLRGKRADGKATREHCAGSCGG